MFKRHSRIERKDASNLDRMECGLIELKFDATNEKEMVFEGYGAVFGNIDSYGDVIAKGAFKETIREAKATGQWPAMLSQHGGMGLSADDMTPIGIWTDMEEDDKGLFMKGKLAPTARGTQSATITTAFTNGSVDGKNMASTASSTVTGTAVGPDFDAVVAGKNASSGAIINGGTILFGDAVGGLTLQDLLISNLSNDAASKALTDLTLTNVTITGSTEFSFSLSGFDSPDTGFSTSTKNAVLSNLYNGDGSGSIAIQFMNKAGTGAAQLRIETDEGAALGGPGAIYVYNLIWTVPEPGTIAVFGAGLLGLAISRQRRRGRAFVALTAKPDEDKAPSAG